MRDTDHPEPADPGSAELDNSDLQPERDRRPLRLSDLSLRWKLPGSFGLILLVLTAIIIASYLTTISNDSADAEVTHTLLVISEANAALSAVIDMESGYRGFLITGEDSFLEPYRAGRPEFDQRIASLIDLSTRSPERAALWRDISAQLDTWQEETATPNIDARRTVEPGDPLPESARQRVISGVGKQQIDQIRRSFADAIDTENALLDERQQRAADANARLRQTLIVGGLIAIGLAVVLAIFLTRDVIGGISRLDQTAARIAGGNLGERIRMRRADEIGDAATSFDRMTDQLQTMLERSEAQARDLTRSNTELEQFAYVASHDLQEPLRAVVSYVQLLEKRYGGQLDERADKYIAYAVDGGRRMQILINDLLVYSRVGRKEAEIVPVESEVALQRALSNLSSSIDDAGAIVTHDPLPIVDAEPSQLVQLFQNLIGNAIKFRGTQTPTVHISAEQRPGDWLFSIRDNGIGISPDYTDRIFIIFQRLHGRDEYEGTGIGLAICKKIVERRGGQLWVESTQGNGATFYFNIPRSTDKKGPIE